MTDPNKNKEKEEYNAVIGDLIGKLEAKKLKIKNTIELLEGMKKK